MTTDELADGLLAVHATLADGLWHAPAGATAPDRTDSSPTPWATGTSAGPT